MQKPSLLIRLGSQTLNLRWVYAIHLIHKDPTHPPVEAVIYADVPGLRDDNPYLTITGEPVRELARLVASFREPETSHLSVVTFKQRNVGANAYSDADVLAIDTSRLAQIEIKRQGENIVGATAAFIVGAPPRVVSLRFKSYEAFGLEDFCAGLHEQNESTTQPAAER